MLFRCLSHNLFRTARGKERLSPGPQSCRKVQFCSHRDHMEQPRFCCALSRDWKPHSADTGFPKDRKGKSVSAPVCIRSCPALGEDLTLGRAVSTDTDQSTHSTMTFLDTMLMTTVAHDDLVPGCVTTCFPNHSRACFYRHLSFTDLKAEGCTDYSCLHSVLLRFAWRWQKWVFFYIVYFKRWLLKYS